ncbi:hypothetical protein ACWU4D_06015 [Vibrio sp. WJH972]
MDELTKPEMPNSAIASTGKIEIELHLIAKGLSELRLVERLTIQNSRPQNLGKLLVGLTPAQALLKIPVLFSLCSQAQQAAAYSALAGARNIALEPNQQSILVERCSLEWVKEHSWQLWMMMRALIGDDYAKSESIAITQPLLKQLQQQPNLSLSSPLPTSSDIDWEAIKGSMTAIFGVMPREFLTLSWSELMRWAKTNAPYATLWSSMLDLGSVRLGSFEHWDPLLESGPLNRAHPRHPLVEQSLALWGPSVVTRVLAKLIELAQACVNPQIASPIVQGHAQSSRGELIHTVSLDQNGVIESYDINAPTDRHFGRNGLMAKSLLGQTISENQLNMVKQLIWAVDPCVDFNVTFLFGNKKIQS